MHYPVHKLPWRISDDLRLMMNGEGRICSTCKRFLTAPVRFLKNRKTCRACLLKAKRRQREKRQQAKKVVLQFKVSHRIRCSSCKCFKNTSDFVQAGKTCFACRNKRRKTQGVIQQLPSQSGKRPVQTDRHPAGTSGYKQSECTFEECTLRTYAWIC